MLSLVIQIVSGAVGGNVAAKLLDSISLGVIGNSIAGILGGGLGGQLLGMLGMNIGNGSFDPANLIGSVASGGIGGGALLVIIAIIRKVLGKLL